MRIIGYSDFTIGIIIETNDQIQPALRLIRQINLQKDLNSDYIKVIIVSNFPLFIDLIPCNIIEASNKTYIELQNLFFDFIETEYFLTLSPTTIIPHALFLRNLFIYLQKNDHEILRIMKIDTRYKPNLNIDKTFKSLYFEVCCKKEYLRCSENLKNYVLSYPNGTPLYEKILFDLDLDDNLFKSPEKYPENK